MTKETFEAALKKVRAVKPKEAFMVVNVTTEYSEKFVLPQTAALALIHALGQAELLTNRYQQPPSIVPLREEAVTTQILSHADYELYKVAALMGVSIQDLKASMQTPSPDPSP